MELTYKIFTDTTTDLTPEWMTENNVGWLEHGMTARKSRTISAKRCLTKNFTSGCGAG